MASKGVRKDKRLGCVSAEGLTALFCRRGQTSDAVESGSCVGDSPRASVGDGSPRQAPPTPSLKSEDTQHDAPATLAIEDGAASSPPPRNNASIGTGSSSAPAALPLSPAASPLATGTERARGADGVDPGKSPKPMRRFRRKTTMPGPILDRILQSKTIRAMAKKAKARRSPASAVGALAHTVAVGAVAVSPPLPGITGELTGPLGPVCCGKCGNALIEGQFQLVGRARSGAKCNRCNTSAVVLHRLFGGWPPKEFEGVPKEQQQLFWRNTHAAKGKGALESLVVDCLTERRMEVLKTSKSGKYLPLSVYKKEGFDWKRIEEHCKDTMVDPVLGLCYRVNILAVEEHTVKETVREQLLSHRAVLATSRAKTAPKAVKDTPATAAVDDLSSCPSDGGSASSQSSTSTDDKKRAKKRKRSRDGKAARDHTAHAQKEKQEKELPKKKRTQCAEEKPNERRVCAAAKAIKVALTRKAAEYRITKRAASVALAKVAPTLASLGQLVGGPLCMQHVPKFVFNAAMKALRAMQHIDQRARDALLPDNPAPLPLLKEESATALRVGKDAEKQLRIMLTAARSHVERQ